MPPRIEHRRAGQLVARGLPDRQNFRQWLIQAGFDAAIYYSGTYLDELYRRALRGELQLGTGENPETHLSRKIGGPGDQFISEEYLRTPAIEDRPAKRRNFGPVPQAMDIDGNNPAGYKQIRFSKSTYGRYKKKSAISRVKQFVRNMQHDEIWRFQSLLTPRPTASTYLTQKTEFNNNGAVLEMPCYCLNLSCIPRLNEASNILAPLYRLQKLEDTDTSAINWTWLPVQGVKNDNEGIASSYKWQLEHSETPMGICERYRHDWTDIRLMLQGCTNFPIRWHLYYVKFAMDGAGPLRQTVKLVEGVEVPEPIDDDSDIAQDKKGQVDYFWERFMFPKIIHPFATTKKSSDTERKLYVLRHEVVNIEAELSFSADLQPQQVIKRLMFKSGKEFDLVDTRETEYSFMRVDAGGTVTTTGISDDRRPGFADNNTWDSTRVFPTREDDTWLMIVAEDYVMKANNPLPNHTPSFDICVRSKFTRFDRAGL